MQIQDADTEGEYSSLLAHHNQQQVYGSEGVEEEDIREIQIECNILSYSVNPSRSIPEAVGDLIHGEPPELLELLHGVYATFRPGELVCLMGASGAGKTTLLNVLSGRAGGVLMGDIKYNGKVLPQKKLRMCMNYIPQDDILMSALTPRECLNYVGELRLNVPERERTRRVEDLMKKLGINRCADVMIGDALNKGISGGQRKRVSVGMELVSNPSILFVDEATTGLDSQTAEELIEILKGIARTGRTVICTIHQPSFEVFSMFDRLLLLDTGRVVYCGPVKDSSQYFSSLGFQCPQYINPIEFFMKVINGPGPVKSKDHDDNLHAPKPALGTELSHDNKKIISRPKTEWHNSWKEFSRESSMRDSDADLQKYNAGSLEQEKFAATFDDMVYPTTFYSQFYTLLRRSFWMTWKDPKQFRARLVLCTIVGLFGGLVYLNLTNEQKDIKNKMSLIFQSIFFCGTNMLNNTVVLFPLERAVITREFRNGGYRMLAYYLARVITGCLFQVVYVAVFVTISYFMAGLYPSMEAFFSFMGGLMLLGAIAVSLGIVIGGLVPTVTLGPAVVSPLLIPLSVFSGFLVTPGKIPVWFLWLYYISFFQYTFHILLTTQFQDVEFDCCNCDADSIGVDTTHTNSSWSAFQEYFAVAAKTEPDYCPLGDGYQYGNVMVKDYYADNDISLETSVAILFVELFLFMLAGFLVMLWRGRQKLS